MKKPEKKTHKCLDHMVRDQEDDLFWCDTCQDSGEGFPLDARGWNDAWDEWEKYHKQAIFRYMEHLRSLPSEEEIQRIITEWDDNKNEIFPDTTDLAKAISKRIRGEE